MNLQIIFGRNPDFSFCHANVQWVTKIRIIKKKRHLGLYTCLLFSESFPLAFRSNRSDGRISRDNGGAYSTGSNGFLLTKDGNTSDSSKDSDHPDSTVTRMSYASQVMHAPSLQCLGAPVSTSKHRVKAICPLVFLVLLLY